MTAVLDIVVVLAAVVVALVYSGARKNRRVVRTPGFVIGGPQTRIDREDNPS